MGLLLILPWVLFFILFYFYVNILFGFNFLAFCDLVWRESYSNGVAYVILVKRSRRKIGNTQMNFLGIYSSGSLLSFYRYHV